jgi:hypothetical protein
MVYLYFYLIGIIILIIFVIIGKIVDLLFRKITNA